jgi:hypothetical protein
MSSKLVALMQLVRTSFRFCPNTCIPACRLGAVMSWPELQRLDCAVHLAICSDICCMQTSHENSRRSVTEWPQYTHRLVRAWVSIIPRSCRLPCAAAAGLVFYAAKVVRVETDRAAWGRCRSAGQLRVYVRPLWILQRPVSLPACVAQWGCELCPACAAPTPMRPVRGWILGGGFSMFHSYS